MMADQVGYFEGKRIEGNCASGGEVEETKEHTHTGWCDRTWSTD